MDMFSKMLNNNTIYHDFNYQIVKKDNQIIREIIPKNIYSDSSSRYFNWIRIDDSLYYFKRFNFNDFIGEELCKELGLSSVHYDLANVKGGIQTISKNFVDSEHKYCNIKNLPNFLRRIEKRDWYVYTIELLIESLLRIGYSKEIVDKLVDDIMKMSAIDFFSRQTDRFFNNYVFMTKDKSIKLAPLYDFGESFSFRGGNHVCNGYNYSYNNELISISWSNFFSEQLLRKYPQLRKNLEIMNSVNLRNIIMYLVNKYNLSINQELLDIYDYEEKTSKTRIKELIK